MTTAEVAGRDDAPTAVPPPARSRPRRDIEGLRAIAVLSVLVYHAGLAWLPGGFAGVDVFFVISGFLITSLMVREVEQRGRLRLARFWARRARRLLPAGTLVLAFSALVTVFCLPAGDRKPFGGDIVAAAFYLVNWRLGDREVDYLAEDVGASPVQHYWSLAVEEQFYIVWPLLIALVVALVSQRRRLALFATVAVLTLASFAWTLHYVQEVPGQAFFVSTTRVWELGVGALLAVAYPVLVRLPQWLRQVAGWAGLAAIATVMLAYEPSWDWPGLGTLLPVLGTAGVILAGGTTPDRGVGAVIGIRPAVWIGALSYSLYLWHWPFIVGAQGLWGDDLRVRHLLLVVAVSAIPAWLSYRYLENPVRESRRLAANRPALVMGGVLTAVAGLTGAAVIASFALVGTVPVANAEESPGAAAIGTRPAGYWAEQRSVEAIRPSPLDAATDMPQIYDDSCVVNNYGDLKQCEYGAPDGERTVVLVGDSKAMQWFTPLHELARAQGWKLVVIGKNGCEFADVVRPGPDGNPNPSCDDWSQRSLAEILDLRPDLVVTVTRWSVAMPGGPYDEDTPLTRKAMVDGLVHHWQALRDAGIAVAPIVDNPGLSNRPECVQENLDDLRKCAFDMARQSKGSGAAAQLEAAERVEGVRPVDMNDLACPDGRTCPAVIGNVIVYRSGTHISDTYAETLTPMLGERMAAATDGLFGTAS
ncbi:acyltransferase [Nocardioides sp. zg-536]|uniref:Acyltransferase n=1 Tax=Nocardioides faecalis TaxID=2803858 RepID=A0A939BWJ2_9ACTN|nr:acyltransferase family protein [Nocardioides faecalis]MBM9460647.1 acyltransferase [Nocardioides faecalis]QVI57436.1 acyltransferase [Nocardioides faecalis]